METWHHTLNGPLYTYNPKNNIVPDNIKLWAVDRNKSLGSGITQEKSITRVATFIFLVDNEEIGRIIESPKSGRLEEDIRAIVNGNGSWEGN